MLNSGRNDCVASCNAYEYPDACSRCFPCHLTCSACTSSSSNSCTGCDSSRALSVLFSSPDRGTCGCKDYFIERSPVQRTCESCHYSCKTCSQASSATSCLSCDTTDRVLTAGSCPCQSRFTEISQACVPCGTNCDACENGVTTNCTSCFPTFWLNPATDTCGTSCPAGQY